MTTGNNHLDAQLAAADETAPPAGARRYTAAQERNDDGFIQAALKRGRAIAAGDTSLAAEVSRHDFTRNGRVV